MMWNYRRYGWLATITLFTLMGHRAVSAAAEPAKGILLSGHLLAAEPADIATSPNTPDRIEGPEEAPSPLWLVVMPAIPIVGGGLVCAKRRLMGNLGTQSGPASTVSSSPEGAKGSVGESSERSPGCDD